MAFEALVSSKPTRRRNQTARLHIYSVESRRAPHLVDVRIRLTRPLMEKLGWSENQRVNVLVGIGEDAGKLLLKPHEDGMFRFQASTPSRSSFVLSSRAIPLPAGLKAYMEWEQLEEGLLVTWT